MAMPWKTQKTRNRVFALSGLLSHLRWPHELARVDAGYEQGDRVEEFTTR